MNEDEQKQLEAEGGSGVTMPAPPPVSAGVAPVGGTNDQESRAGAQMVGSAIDAAVAPGQSVVDAAKNAETEAQLRGVAQAVTAADRFRATQNGMESPPSQWAQDVNNLFTGLTSAARRAAERIYQPQTQQVQQPAQEPQQPVGQDVTIGADGKLSIGDAGGKTQPATMKNTDLSFDMDLNAGAQKQLEDYTGGLFA